MHLVLEICMKAAMTIFFDSTLVKLFLDNFIK